MSLFRNSLLLLGAASVRLPIGFLLNILLARALSLHDRGLYDIVISVSAIVILLGGFGWPSSAVYHIRRRTSNAAAVLGAGLLTTGLYCVLAGLLAWATHPWLPRLLHIEASTLLYVALLTVPFQLLAIFTGAVARAMDRFELPSTYRVGLASGRLLAVATILLAADGGVLEVLAALVGVQALAALWLWKRVSVSAGVALPASRAEWTGLLRFGAKGWTQTQLGKLLERIDILLIAFLLADTALNAFYGIAVVMATFLMVLPESLAEAVYPELSGQDRTAAGATVALMLRNTLFWTLTASLAMAIAAPLLVPLLFGSAYAESVAPLLILLAWVTLFSVFRILLRYFLAIDRIRTTLWIQALVTASAVLLYALLIPKFGITGAASGRVLAQLLGAVLILGAFRRTSGQRLVRTLLIRRSDLGAYRQHLRRLVDRLRSDDARPAS